MKERMLDMVVKYSNAQALKKKISTLFRARQEVEINGNGTSGYVVKHGPNKGKVLKHIKVESNTI